MRIKDRWQHLTVATLQNACETVVDECESVSDVKCVCHTLNGCELAGLQKFPQTGEIIDFGNISQPGENLPFFVV